MSLSRNLFFVSFFVLTPGLVIPAPGVQADEVLLNEWNAVGSTKSIANGDAFFGTDYLGNGGNWFELVTVADVDLRGWELRWTEDEPAANGAPTSEGTLTFSQGDLWSSIQAGTIITIIETEDGDGQGAITATDTSYDPASGDWDIVISTFAEADTEAPLITTVTNDGEPSAFSVGNDDWQLSIFDAAGTRVSGPTGEGAVDDAGNEIWTAGGISSNEAGSLEGPPRGSPLACWESITAASSFYDDTKSSSFGLPNVDFVADGESYRTTQDLTALRGGRPEGFGDFDSSGEYDVADLELLNAQISSGQNSPCFDLTDDGNVDAADVTELIHRVGLTRGDADLDGDVDEADFELWNASKFTDQTTWVTGDFTGDGMTDVSDFNSWNANKSAVDGPFNSSLPEPSAGNLLGLGLLASVTVRRRMSKPA